MGKPDFYMCDVEVDGETLEVVTEWGEGTCWVPGEEHTFQVYRGQRIAGTSFGAFGSDRNLALESERRWIDQARSFYEMYVGGWATDECR